VLQSPYEPVDEMVTALVIKLERFALDRQVQQR
jgi:hypothetical protein